MLEPSTLKSLVATAGTRQIYIPKHLAPTAPFLLKWERGGLEIADASSLENRAKNEALRSGHRPSASHLCFSIHSCFKICLTRWWCIKVSQKTEDQTCWQNVCCTTIQPHLRGSPRGPRPAVVRSCNPHNSPERLSLTEEEIAPKSYQRNEHFPKGWDRYRWETKVGMTDNAAGFWPTASCSPFI